MATEEHLEILGQGAAAALAGRGAAYGCFGVDGAEGWIRLSDCPGLAESAGLGDGRAAVARRRILRRKERL
jgi:hypothetical protein